MAASDPSSCLRTPRDGRHPYGQVRVLGATGRQRLRRDLGRGGAGKAGRLRDLPLSVMWKSVSGLVGKWPHLNRSGGRETWERAVDQDCGWPGCLVEGGSREGGEMGRQRGRAGQRPAGQHKQRWDTQKQGRQRPAGQHGQRGACRGRADRGLLGSTSKGGSQQFWS